MLNRRDKGLGDAGKSPPPLSPARDCEFREMLMVNWGEEEMMALNFVSQRTFIRSEGKEKELFPWRVRQRASLCAKSFPFANLALFEGRSPQDKTRLNGKPSLRRRRSKEINRLAISPFGQLFVSRLLPVSSPPTCASPLGRKFDRAIDSIVEIG